MKKVLLGFILIVFFSCKKTSSKTENLNELSDLSFEDYFLDHKDAHKNESIYIDSLISLPDLKNSHKGKVFLYKMALSMVEKEYDKALKYAEKVYELNEGKETALLVNYYYHLGRLQELKNKQYQALYYYNKAGEILKRTGIYNTIPRKADFLLIFIAEKNKEMALNSSANRYLDLAVVNNRINASKTDLFDEHFNRLKASIYASVTMLNKDSVNHYLSFIPETKIQKINYKMSAKAEYFYNSCQLDSSLYYLNKIEKFYWLTNNNNKLNFKIHDYQNSINYKLNLLTVYSRQNKIKEANIVLESIEKNMKKGELKANDSLLYFQNVIDYHIARKDYANIKKSVQEYSVFREKFNNKEIRKNINELGVVLDLKHKDKEIEKTNVKYLKSVQTRNKFIGLSVFLLLIGTIIALYFRGKILKRRLTLEKNGLDLKMKLLQSQINPHFIFNTLASIQSLIRQGKNEESIRYLNKFSSLMRQILNLSRDEQTSLEKELIVLKSYVEVQQLRKNNFDLTIHLNDEVQDLQSEIAMPALSLQPFIENAILHGFKGIDYRGKIVVNILSDEKYLHINITDNGIGLHNKEESEQKSHGIDIIKEQFEILGKSHKSETEFIIEDRKETLGVLVNIKIPLILIG